MQEVFAKMLGWSLSERHKAEQVKQITQQLVPSLPAWQGEMAKHESKII